MFNLILKDLLIQKKMAIFSFILYPFIAIVAFQSMPEGMFIMGSASIAYILITTAFSYDEQYKADIYINSLPVRKKDIVNSKYVSLLVFSIIGIVVMLIYLFGAKFFNIEINMGKISWIKITLVFFCNVIIYGIQFPLYFKYGYTKMRLISIFLYIFFVMGLSMISSYFTDGRFKFIENIPQILAIIILILLMLLILTISAEISLKFYKNREN